MARATIQDVAKLTGVSVATVNRALHSPEKVREETLRSILETAEKIGFYGLGSIQKSVKSIRPKIRIGIQLLQSHRALYRVLADAYQKAAREYTAWDVQIDIAHVDELSPQNISDTLERLAQTSHVIGMVSAEHPIVTRKIEDLSDRGIKTFAIVSPIIAGCNVGYIGMDHWKVGRTAAWFLQNVCQKNGKVGLFVGNPRFRCQETTEASFRSYFREHPVDFDILETQSIFESASIAQDLTEKLIDTHKDLIAIYVDGGGISGVCAALRASRRAEDIIVVAHDMTDTTRNALLDGTINFVIAQPIPAMTRKTISAMIRAYENGSEFPPESISLPFDIFTRENI